MVQTGHRLLQLLQLHLLLLHQLELKLLLFLHALTEPTAKAQPLLHLKGQLLLLLLLLQKAALRELLLLLLLQLLLLQLLLLLLKGRGRRWTAVGSLALHREQTHGLGHGRRVSKVGHVHVVDVHVQVHVHTHVEGDGHVHAEAEIGRGATDIAVERTLKIQVVLHHPSLRLAHKLAHVPEALCAIYRRATAAAAADQDTVVAEESRMLHLGLLQTGQSIELSLDSLTHIKVRLGLDQIQGGAEVEGLGLQVVEGLTVVVVVVVATDVTVVDVVGGGVIIVVIARSNTVH